MQPQTDTSVQIPLIIDLEEAAATMNEVFMSMKHSVLLKPNPAWKDRFVRLDRLENMILENKERIEAAIYTDFGCRDAFVTDMLDIFPTLSQIRYLKKNAEKWMKPRSFVPDPYLLPGSEEVIFQPKGVVGIIAPWNYPLFLSIGSVAQAFAAGNLCMLKLSETTPVFSSLIEELVQKYFMPNELYVVLGESDISSRFAELPFDHLLFIGSTQVGRKVAQAAAKNLTPVTLELGGKSPAVIAPNYPLDAAVERIMVGKLLNSGQTCIAPDYVLIERRGVRNFVDICRKEARKLYPAGLADPSYTSIVSQSRFESLLNQLQEASQTSKVESLFLGDQFDLKTRKLGPQIVLNPPPDIEVMSEEIFGPILPVIAYPDDDIGEAVDFINSRPHPLAMYWFDNNKKRVKNIVSTVPCGGITVNDTILHAVSHNLPFGGVGQSGMGRYMGKAGFESFSNLKSVFYQSKLNFVDTFNPPYSEKAHSIVKSMIQGKSMLSILLKKDKEQDE